MEREIKFRAWSKTNKKLIDLQKITPLALNASMNTQMALQGSGGLFIPFHNDIVVEQFTGLKDCKGKDIYEGDTLEIRNLKSQYQKAILIGTVVFQYSSFGVEIKQIPQWEGYSEFASRPNIVWFLNIIDNKEFEVIGNTHEGDANVEDIHG